MEKEKEKHKHLMEEVKYSGDKKRVEEFFRKMASQIETTELNSDKPKSGSAESQIKEHETDVELLQADAAFTQLLSDMSDLYNHSSTFAFGKDVLEELSSTVEDVFEEIQEADEYFHHSNRDAESLSSFGQHPNGYLCRTLRRQASECWQLQNLCENCGSNLIKECPRLQQLHSEMEEMHTLLNVSRLQYDDRLQLVRRHTADTQRWLADTGDEYGWISWVANVSGAQSNIFRVIAMNLQQQLRTNSPGADSSVVVSVLDSAPLTVSVPAALMVEDPAFMEYIAHHALTLYKQHIRRKCSS
ncbi:clusterin-like protein 1 [Poecilia reticulata]|uniref:clusterin-like protein 1 n=1 Tax=Poecilia reticulata TaxID=8081 RepID=UPI0004A35735|nr:PREDICTED: clusterin-like protein 1 [Poecilia reticulata]